MTRTPRTTDSRIVQRTWVTALSALLLLAGTAMAFAGGALPGQERGVIGPIATQRPVAAASIVGALAPADEKPPSATATGGAAETANEGRAAAAAEQVSAAPAKTAGSSSAGSARRKPDGADESRSDEGDHAESDDEHETVSPRLRDDDPEDKSSTSDGEH